MIAMKMYVKTWKMHECDTVNMQTDVESIMCKVMNPLSADIRIIGF